MIIQLVADNSEVVYLFIHVFVSPCVLMCICCVYEWIFFFLLLLFLNSAAVMLFISLRNMFWATKAAALVVTGL